MGETKKQAFQLSFHKFLRIAFQGSRVISDGGLVLVRELDERLGVSTLIENIWSIFVRAETSSFRWLICFVSPFAAGWRVMKT